MLPTPGMFVRNILRELHRATDSFVKSALSLPDFLENHDKAFIYSPHYLLDLFAEFNKGKFMLHDDVPGGCVRGRGTRYVYVEEAEKVIRSAIIKTHSEKMIVLHPPEESPVLLLLSPVFAMKQNAIKIERMNNVLKKAINTSIQKDFLHLERVAEKERQLADEVLLVVSRFKQELTPSAADIDLVAALVINIHHFASQALDTLELSKRK